MLLLHVLVVVLLYKLVGYSEFQRSACVTSGQLYHAIAEHGYPNSLICVFYLNNQSNNGDKISKLPDKKSFFYL